MIQHLAVKYYTQGLDSDDVLMSLSAHILSLFLAATVITSVATMNLQQAFAFGFVERQQIGEFQKLTAQFEYKFNQQPRNITTATFIPGFLEVNRRIQD